MKAVMISVSPTICEKVASGDCTILVRKTRPKIDIPFKCYIYETKSYDTLFGKGKPKKLCVGGGKVIGEFVCDVIYGVFGFLPYGADYIHHLMLPYILEQTCLQDYEIDEYLGAKDGYGWHISDLVIYDEPRELSEFEHPCPKRAQIIGDCRVCKYLGFGRSYRGMNCKCEFTRPPQSWQYVEEKESDNG